MRCVRLWRSLAQLEAVPETSRFPKCNHARPRTAQARACATERTIGHRLGRTSTTDTCGPSTWWKHAR
eukprot:6479751-Prymnesium_polylepis.1